MSRSSFVVQGEARLQMIVHGILSAIAINAAPWTIPAPLSAAPTGRLIGDVSPGLKPWAVLLDHFMVNNRKCQLTPLVRESHPTLRPEELHPNCCQMARLSWAG
jgi:hypothetical protein